MKKTIVKEIFKQDFHCLAKEASAKVILLQHRANVERQKFCVGANVTLDVCV
jgi:hypothetical protein